MSEQKSGKLKIGDDGSIISIIALSQSNPLKAVAEFVENSIDAAAANITITRAKREGVQYLKIKDDGEGIDDFEYVATHIGDSIKRRLKKSGARNIQGEFGIGLLSFWTVGEELILTSTGTAGLSQRMRLVKGNQGYLIEDAPALFKSTGTELYIAPLLPGIRTITGEKIQNYLASELRDRINKTGVNIKILDKVNRRELIVEPRKFKGRLLHHLPQPRSPFGEIYCELYINEPSRENTIGIYRQGTRVIPDITSLEAFAGLPWKSEYLEGLIDVPFLSLTPGTREGIIFDDRYDSFMTSMDEMSAALLELIEEQKQAEEESASKTILNRVAKAFREAFLFLPLEDYAWLPVLAKRKKAAGLVPGAGEGTAGTASQGTESVPESGPDDGESPLTPEALAEAVLAGPQTEGKDKEFFLFAGPLHKAVVYPASAKVRVGGEKKLRAFGKDKRGRVIDDTLHIEWKITSGPGILSDFTGEFSVFKAPAEPGITTVEAAVTQNDTVCTAEAVITVTEELIQSKGESSALKHGLPGYTYKNSPGELWRSNFDLQNYVIVINKGHGDFVHASKKNSSKLRYINKLFAKELVLANFPELSGNDLLERMVELSLYTEETL